jgi:multidrug efflux pump subunit AcrA (membrane-fusion protein)
MKTKNLIIVTGIFFLTIACQETNDLEKKRAELKEKKSQLNELRTEITTLENEIATLDPEFAKANRKATLVSTLPVNMTHFESYLEISGSVESRKNVDITAETIGNIERIYVDKGQFVKSGQLLIKLENDVLKRNLEELQTSYELAKTMFERQSNLWAKKIGTEVQYLEAKKQERIAGKPDKDIGNPDQQNIHQGSFQRNC